MLFNQGKRLFSNLTSLRRTFWKKMMSSDSLCNDKQHGKLPLLNLNKIKTKGREVQWPNGYCAEL